MKLYFVCITWRGLLQSPLRIAALNEDDVYTILAETDNDIVSYKLGGDIDIDENFEIKIFEEREIEIFS